VPDDRVHWITAKVYEQTVEFDDYLRIVEINLAGNSHVSGICTNSEIFTLVVKFQLPDAAISLSEARSSVRGLNQGPDADTNNHDWFVNGAAFQNVNLSDKPKIGEMHISLFRRRTSGPNDAPSLAVTVAGNYQSSTFSGHSNVKILCP
jgi:hypothetical protein